MEEKFSDISEQSKVEMKKKVLNTFFMSIMDNVLCEIAAEKMAFAA